MRVDVSSASAVQHEVDLGGAEVRGLTATEKGSFGRRFDGEYMVVLLRGTGWFGD